MDFFQDSKTAQDLYTLFFTSGLWNTYDQGLYDGASLKEKAIHMAPLYQEEIDRMIPTWASFVRPFENSIELMKQLKQEGYKIYILSNIPEDSYRYFIEHDNIFANVDGGIYSYQDHLIKPDPAIFQLLLKRYDLQANECLFIDDKEENTKAAKELGFYTITLEDPKMIEQKVRGKLYEVQGQ